MAVSNKQKAKWIWRSLKRILDEYSIGKQIDELYPDDRTGKTIEDRIVEEITIQLNELDLGVYKSNTRNED